MDIQGKLAVITGAGRGIGREMALELAREGARVACLARTANQLAETCSLIEKAGGKAETFVVDVTDADVLRRVAEQVATRMGEVDILINNAGSFSAVGAMWDVDATAWWQDVSINMLGPFLVSRAFLPALMKREEAVIVNLCGGGADRPFLGASAYGSSKTGLMRLTDTMAFELKKAGHANIQVYGFDPGLVRTAMTETVIKADAAKEWLPSMIEWMAGGEDHPVEESAKALVKLVKISRPEISGRIFCYFQDFKEINRRAGDIEARDTFQIRYLTHL